MPTDPESSAPSDPLSEVPLKELIERARHVAEVMETRGELMAALRARDMSWRKIEAETGIAQSTVRRWVQEYLDTQQ